MTYRINFYSHWGCLAITACLAVATGTATAHEAHMQSPADQASAPATLPGESVYLLMAPLTDQDGKVFRLDARRGQPVLISMFYTSCKFVCPMLVDTMRLTEQALTPAERKRLAVTLVSFDPARDTTAALKAMADGREIDRVRWTLARPSDANARKIAATLGIQYRLLPDGEYNHTTVLILLDSEGRIAGSTRKIGGLDPAFVKLIKQTLRDTAPRA